MNGHITTKIYDKSVKPDHPLFKKLMIAISIPKDRRIDFDSGQYLNRIAIKYNATIAATICNWIIFSRNTIVKQFLDTPQLTHLFFLDADTIWLPQKKVSDVFKSMKDELLFQCRGRIDIKDNGKTLWTTTQAIREAYKLTSGYYYNLSSEFVYFNRSKENSAFFKLAQKEYDHLKVHCAPFGGATPDELPFAIAMLKKEVKHKSEYHPIYWELEQKRLLAPAQMHAEFIAYSMGGNHQNRNMFAFYNNLVKWYGRKWGETNLFLWQNKQLWQPMRSHV